ncbi:helix-turn-helix transcriptional regulator [Clostridium sp. 'deep sea']|uniref:AraC family transcriptional regulator n=1 Tax=Clostridium sp. 'deep sea' TaxID=2779445 RepID=UPI0018969865|nr:AraC family transcriptional regulator [Clostridium sp. 'deep sea']QOR36168.1 helix-turn-helix transcriptional regulator [Clostridium sp. 'deep sea']
MPSIIKDSFYINKIAELVFENEHYQTYKILPQYGRGIFTIHKIIPGLNLAYNNFFLKNKLVNQAKDYQWFSDSLLKINYCIKGKMFAYNKAGRVCISNGGTSSYYYGTENIYAVDHFEKHYESITIFGYMSQIINTFTAIFNIKEQVFIDFINEINVGKEFMVIKSNSIVMKLVNEIYECCNKNNPENIKLKTIELLFYEIKNIQRNKNTVEQYYNRTTIDKVMGIEQYLINNVDKKITVNDLCKKFNITLDTLKRCFKQMYNQSIYAYLKMKRMTKGKELLEHSNLSITEIALNCGYSNHHSFGKAFKQTYKIPPREIRKKA